MSKFQFKTNHYGLGWCEVIMTVNDITIEFDASYLGENPLISMIEACNSFIKSTYEFRTVWLTEPGRLVIDLKKKSKKIRLDIIQFKDLDGLEMCGEWHETILFDDFKTIIISEAFRVLGQYGLIGFEDAWCDNEEFPLTKLLRVTKSVKTPYEGDKTHIDFLEKIERAVDYLKQNSADKTE